MPQNIFKIYDGRTGFWHYETTKYTKGVTGYCPTTFIYIK